MKKILYLHGLESKPGGEKVDYLSSTNYVCAPSIDYKRNDIFLFINNLIETIKPDIIIGSSMGGYSAMLFSSLHDIPFIAFNPALHSRNFEPNYPKFLNKNKFKNGKIILGDEDMIINSYTTLTMLNKICEMSTIKLNFIKNLPHQIPLDIFIQETINELQYN